MTTIRVLIVDDQDIVRHGLGVILRHQPGIEVAGFAADGQEALEQVAQHRPDVVLMDLKMPRMNGIQATRQITKQFPAVKVVVLTTYDGDEWVFDAIRAGACGYLLKDSDGEEIVAAVRGAVAGEVRIDPAVAGKVLQEFNRLAGQTGRQAPKAIGSQPRPAADRGTHRARADRSSRTHPRQDQPRDRRVSAPGRRHRQELRQHHHRQAPGQRPDASRHFGSQARTGDLGVTCDSHILQLVIICSTVLHIRQGTSLDVIQPFCILSDLVILASTWYASNCAKFYCRHRHCVVNSPYLF